MKYRIVIIGALAVMVTALFIHALLAIERAVESMAIEDINLHQKSHASQAAEGIRDYFTFLNKQLSFIVTQDSIIDFDRQGKALMESFHQLHKGEFEIQAITRINQHGRILYTVPYIRESIGKDISSQKHIRDLIQNKKPVISDVFLSVQGTNSVSLNVPVFRGKEFKGSVGLLISFERLASRYIKEIRIGKKSTTRILSASGLELYTPVPGHIGKRIFDNYSSCPEIIHMAEDMMKGKSGAVKYRCAESGGKDDVATNYAVYMPIPIMNTFWSILVSSPEKEVMFLMKAFRQKQYILMVLLLVCGIAIVYFFIRKIILAYEQKKRLTAENALEKRNDDYRKLIESSRSIILKMDNTGNITFFNEFAQRFFGFCGCEILGRNVVGTIVPHYESSGRDLEAMIKNLTMYPDRYATNVNENMKRGEDRVWISWTNKPIYDENGMIKEIMCIGNDITDLKHAKDDLEEYQRRLSEIIDFLPDATFVIDKEGKIVAWNRATEEMTGICKHEIIGHDYDNCAIAVYGHKRPLLADCILNKNEDLSSKYSHLEKKGNTYYAETFAPSLHGGEGAHLWIAAAPIYDSERNIICIIETIKDITARRKAEDNLAISEQQLRAILQASPVGIGRMSDRKLEWANEAMSRITGYDLAEMLGQDVVHLYESEDEYNRVGRILYSEGEIETKWMRKDGEIRDISLHITQTASYAYIFAAMDITDRKRVEGEILKEKALFNTVINSLPGIFYMFDQQQRPVLWNNELARLSGHTEEELAHSTMFNKIVEEDREKVRTAIQRLYDNGQANVEAKITTKNSIRSFYLTGRRLQLENELFIVGTGYDISDRKKAEEQLRKSEENFRGIFENSVMGIFQTTPCGKYLKINKAGYRMYGYGSVEDMILSVEDVRQIYVDPEKRAMLKEIMDHEGRVEAFEVEHYRKDKSKIWVLLNSRAICADNGKKIYYETTIEDITERKKAQEALINSEANLSAIMNSTSDWIWSVDVKNFAFLTFNPALKEYFLRSAGIDIQPGMTLEKVIPVDRIPIWDGFYRRALNDGSYFAEYYAVRGGLTMLISFNLMKRDGKVFAISAFGKDITDIKKTEEALRDSESKFKTLYESANDAILLLKNERFVDCNTKTLEMYGCISKDQILGKTPIDFSPLLQPDGRATENKARKMIDAACTGNPQIFYWKHNRLDGEMFDAEVSLHALDMHGETVLQAMVRDVTRQKKLENQLRQTQKMEAIGTLAGGIAHDFNNILAGIIGYTELYKDAVADRPKVFNSMQQVLKAADRAKDLVQQILTFSRQKEQAKCPVKVIPLIKEVCKFLRASLPANIEIRQELNVESDLIMADATQMHQVLMNLCTNAGHAMTGKGGLLAIALRQEDIAGERMALTNIKCGRYLVLTVSDTGKGIPPEHLGKIFEPYFTTKKIGEGTGLGLSVVDGIVQSHGGAIELYSEVGKGSAFHIYFPLLEEQSRAIVERNSKPLPKGDERILFVDDERMLTELGKKSLEMLGYNVVAENNPARAIDLFRQEKDAFDIVITDKTMPHMNGFDLAREIRNISAGIPIILCSGFQNKGDLEQIATLGISDFIAKPISPSKLAESVRRVLDNN